MVTRILSDGGDRIWEIRDMETAGFLKKEAVHASFSSRRIHFTPTENAEHLWNEASILFKVPSMQSATFRCFLDQILVFFFVAAVEKNANSSSAPHEFQIPRF